MERLTGSITKDVVIIDVTHSEMVTVLWNELGLKSDDAHIALQEILQTGYWRNDNGSVQHDGIGDPGITRVRYTIRIYAPIERKADRDVATDWSDSESVFEWLLSRDISEGNARDMMAYAKRSANGYSYTHQSITVSWDGKLWNGYLQ